MLLVLFAFASLASNIPSSQDTPTSPLSPEDIILGLKDAELRIKNMSLTSDMSIIEIPRKENSSPKKEHIIATFTVDAQGRSRFKRDAFSDTNTMISSLIETYDGKSLRSIEGFGDPFTRFQFGRISANADERKWMVNPWDYTTSLTGQTISSLISAHGIEESSQADWDGRSVIRIVTKTITTDQDYRNAYWIDIERGFVVVKKSQLVRSRPDSDWFEFHTIESREMTELKDSIWVPSLIEVKTYQPKSTNPKPVLRCSYTIRNANWVINEENLPDDTFELEFPPDVSVEDKKRGTRYHTASIDDQTLIDSAAELRTMKSVDGHHLTRRSVYKSLSLALGAVLLGLGGASVIRRKVTRR